MGKITSKDVHPIIQKFKRLTKTNKITAADVAGPSKTKKKSKMSEPALRQGSISRSSSTLSVGKKIAIAFKEEVLGTSLLKDYSLVASDSNMNIMADDIAFSLPQNTFAIGIDDSKIQRKLIAKFFATAGIPESELIMSDYSSTTYSSGITSIFNSFTFRSLHDHRRWQRRDYGV